MQIATKGGSAPHHSRAWRGDVMYWFWVKHHVKSRQCAFVKQFQGGFGESPTWLIGSGEKSWRKCCDAPKDLQHSKLGEFSMTTNRIHHNQMVVQRLIFFNWGWNYHVENLTVIPYLGRWVSEFAKYGGPKSCFNADSIWKGELYESYCHRVVKQGKPRTWEKGNTTNLSETLFL